MSGSSGSGESYDAKGQEFTKKNCQKIQLSWSEISKRIESLIKADRYLTDVEKATIQQRAAEAAAVDDAADLSDEIDHISDEMEKVEHSDFSTTANIYAHLEYSSKLSSASAMLSGLGIADEKNHSQNVSRKSGRC